MALTRRIDLWVGVVFAALGLIGLLFSRGGSILGLFPVNTALGVLYLVTAGFLFFGATNDERAPSYAGLAGIVYLALGLIGLVFPGFGLFGLFPVYGLNVALFLVVALILVTDWLATPSDPPRRAT
jgi:heme A synthase